jgi:hypothetical protein
MTSHNQLIKVPTLEKCIELVRTNDKRVGNASPTNVLAKAKQLYNDWEAAAEYERAVNKMIATMYECDRPIDQGRTPDPEESQRLRFSDHHWAFVRRWPWFVVCEDDHHLFYPPWKRDIFCLGEIPDVEHHIAVANCLLHCVENPTHLPQFAPIRKHEYTDLTSNPTELPPSSMVVGKWIPRGIVKQFQTAQCGEALAFVLRFSGNPDIEEIHRLIQEPTSEKVAKAYAIAQTPRFCWAEMKVTETDNFTVPIGTNNLKHMAPEQGGTPQTVNRGEPLPIGDLWKIAKIKGQDPSKKPLGRLLSILRSQRDEWKTVFAICGKVRGRVNTHMKENLKILEGFQLAEERPDSEGGGWRLGRAAYPKYSETKR